jgi:hypothetical protein
MKISSQEKKESKRKVISFYSVGKGSAWMCKLECGHAVTRPVKRRRSANSWHRVDPSPTWVYCEKCLSDTLQKSNASRTKRN